MFSAGLDIMEMYKPKVDRMKEFWSTLQDVWFKLYGSPFPTVAAINVSKPNLVNSINPIKLCYLSHPIGSFPCRRLSAVVVLRVSGHVPELHDRVERDSAGNCGADVVHGVHA